MQHAHLYCVRNPGLPSVHFTMRSLIFAYVPTPDPFGVLFEICDTFMNGFSLSESFYGSSEKLGLTIRTIRPQLDEARTSSAVPLPLVR